MTEALAAALRDTATLDRWLLLGVLVAARIAPLTVLAPWLTLRQTPPFLRGALILALTVVGRLFGLGVWEAVYLAALLLTGVGSLLYRLGCRTGAK